MAVLMADLEGVQRADERARRIVVQIVGADQLAKRLAGQALQGRQFAAQFGGGQEFMKRHAETMQAVNQQIAPTAKMVQAATGILAQAVAGSLGRMETLSKAIGASVALKVMQDSGLKNLSSAMFGKQISGLVGSLAPTLTGLSKTLDTCLIGPGLRNYERGRRILRNRGVDAARVLEHLPDDATFGDIGDAMLALLFGDPRARGRLRAKAQEYPEVVALLDWIADAKRVLSELANAAFRFVALVAHGLQSLLRAASLAGCVCQEPAQHAYRSPCQDMVTTLHAPRPPHTDVSASTSIARLEAAAA
jgi:hypothetical protein